MIRTKEGKFKILLAVLTALLFSMPATSKVTVTAKLDSVKILMGSLARLSLEVVQDKNQTGGFTVFRNANPAVGFVSVCGDSVELRTSFSVDTVEIGSGRVQLNYTVPVQAFDSGTYRLPEFVYVAGNDSAFSNRVSLSVYPMKVTAEDPIAGFAPVSEPDGKSVLDAVPDWLADFWWVIVLAVLLAAAVVWALMRYKKEGTVLRKRPLPSPYEVAMKSLRTLKGKNLWEQGMEKEYFTRLTDILRVYLDHRFGINAMEMTSREIIAALNRSDIREKREYLRQILKISDFVKFAKVRPLPADNIEAYDNAVKFVEETKPVADNESEGSRGIADDSTVAKQKDLNKKRKGVRNDA